VSQTSGRPRRVLIVGDSAGSVALRLAREVGTDGLLICLDGDRDAARRAAAAFANEGLGDRANVMPGDPALFIRKVAGPFDVIAIRVDDPTAARVEPHLARLLAPGGRVIRGDDDGGLG
jgi:predicted O-methyltransferase YrrM